MNTSLPLYQVPIRPMLQKHPAKLTRKGLANRRINKN